VGQADCKCCTYPFWRCARRSRRGEWRYNACFVRLTFYGIQAYPPAKAIFGAVAVLLAVCQTLCKSRVFVILKYYGQGRKGCQHKLRCAVRTLRMCWKLPQPSQVVFSDPMHTRDEGYYRQGTRKCASYLCARNQTDQARAAQ
jgi:hypothetical protein